MLPSISDATANPTTAVSTSPSTGTATTTTTTTATATTVSSLSPEQIDAFKKQYPDYDEEESEFPLWIEGVDTTYAPFIPTSTRRVLVALEMAHISPLDRVLDVGSGDGRFCFAAVELFGAQKAIGIEYELDLVEKSTELAQGLVDQGKITFLQADLTNWRDSSTMLSKEWTVIIVFLSPEGGSDMEDWLIQEFERGVRIVALVFNLKHLKGLHCSVEDSQEGIWIYEKPQPQK